MIMKNEFNRGGDSIIKNILKDSLLKNSVYIITTSFFNSILGFIFWIIAARFYITSDIGIGSALVSGMSLITMISSIGLSKALFFYLPRNQQNANKIINSCIITNIIISMIVSLVFVLGIDIWTPGLKSILGNLENIIIFIMTNVILNISGIMGAVFSAGRKSSFYMIKEIIYHSTKIFPLFLFISLGAMGIFLSFNIGLIISTIIGFILLSRLWKYSPKFILDPIIKDMARFSFGNYIADIFYNFPRLIFPIMILNLISEESAGYFYIAFMMAGSLYGIPQSISTSLLVESSDKDKLLSNVYKAIKFNMILLTSGIILFVLFGKYILEIFNPSYAKNAVTTMIILTLSSIPLSLIIIFNTVMNAQNRVYGIIKMNALVATITIILSILLIKMNIEGIALSYLIANIIGATIAINRIKNSKEFTLKLLKDIKNDISYL